MNKHQLLIASAATILALNLTGPVTAQTSKSNTKADDNSQAEAQKNNQENGASSMPRPVTQQELKKRVTKVNRASSFIGMKVENLQNQDLGKVEDLVFDPESGKVDYVVLSVGGFLGISDKYLAVPLKDLVPAPGEDHLIMNADRQQLERAPGFAKNRWPDLGTQPSSAAAGFAKPSKAAGGTGKAGEPQAAGGGEFSGTLSAVDTAERTITVKGDSGTRTFHLDQGAEITAGQQQHAKLDDLKPGSKVTIQFAKEGDKTVAKSVQSSESADKGKKE